MPQNDHLIPVFIPPLANMLARAEQLKGGPLSETEVVRLRDEAPCIMMDPSDADQMTEKRGFRDVNPENCWADWHRLRVQFTGNGYLPKIVLCVLGGADFAERSEPILKAEGTEYEYREHDARMVTSFTASACRARPSLQEEDFAEIAKHVTVLYALSKNFSAQEASGATHACLRLGHRLLEAGGIGMKCESSGIAHSRSRWIEWADQAQRAHQSSFGANSDAIQAYWEALFLAYVQLPIYSGVDFYTCGMHLLGVPDFIVADALLQKVVNSSQSQGLAAVELFHVFGMYLLAECPTGKFASGHTFRINNESPRYRVVWEECAGYDEDDFFFNPFGRWRFTEL